METVKIACGETRELLFTQGTYPNTAQVPGVTVSSSSNATTTIAPEAGGTGLMTVAGAVTGYLSPGNMISGTNILPNTLINEQLTGTLGGAGTYRVNKSQTFASGAITADGSGTWQYKQSPYATFHAEIAGTSGAQTATVVIDVSNDGESPINTAAGTISLSGTIANSDGFATASSWKYVRARVTAISGTGAVVTCHMGT